MVGRGNSPHFLSYIPLLLFWGGAVGIERLTGNVKFNLFYSVVTTI